MSWPTVKISEVAEINPKLQKGIDEAQDITFLPMAAISENGKVIGGEIRKLKDVKKGFTYFERKDILIAKITPCFENGKAAILKDLPTPIGFGSTEFHVIRPIVSKVDPEYLFTMLWNTHFRTIGAANMTGSAGQKRLPVKFIQEFSIPLPPLALQKEISERILKSRQLIQQSIEMEYQLNALAQAVFLEMFGDPVCNTKRWPTKKLSQVVSISSGGTPSKSNDSYWQGEFPWVSPKDMKIDYLSDAIDHISDLVFEETNIKKIPVGTILVVVRGMILVHSIPLAMNLCDIAINQDIKALTVCNDSIETEFLFHCLKNQKDHILSKVSTAAHGTKRLDTPDLLGLEIIVPPLDLQYKYVEIMRKNAGMIECYKQSSLTNKQLFDSLMQRAFSGNLDLKKVA